MISRRAFVRRLVTGATGAGVVLAGGANRAQASRLVPGADGSGSASAAAAPQLAESGPFAPQHAQADFGVTDSGLPATSSGTPPWELLVPFGPGSVVANGWRIADFSGIVDGTTVVTLEDAHGHSHRVHICRNDGTPQGLLFTERLDLVVMNGGRGDLPTEEGFAQAVAAIARVLAKNENSACVTALLPHAERVRLYSVEGDRRLR